jgi:ABC-type glycerol-3-phosphate transport system permease component
VLYHFGRGLLTGCNGNSDQREVLEAARVDGANEVNSLGQNWHLLTAAAFVSMALPLVVFFSLQRYFVRGILAGSVKG